MLMSFSVSLHGYIFLSICCGSANSDCTAKFQAFICVSLEGFCQVRGDDEKEGAG